MANLSGNLRGKKGRSGRKPQSVENKFWAKLDGALPEAIDFCLEVIENTKINLLNKKLKQSEAINLQNVGLKAAQILMSKAPQRVEGQGDNGEFVFKLVNGNYAL